MSNPSIPAEGQALAAAPPPPYAPPDDIPIIYEDDEEPDLGESNLHVKCDEILHVGLGAHFAATRPQVQVFSNMNVYYREGPLNPATGSRPYISPDGFAVEPFEPLPETQCSYTIGVDGPAPLLVAEILSPYSAARFDFTAKPVIYAKLEVQEYILIDESGEFLKERLLLRRLQADGTYKEERDPDGGITSQLGFRLIFEPDGLRVIDAATGHRYARPKEAEAHARERRIAEEALERAVRERKEAERRRKEEEAARKRAEQAREQESAARRQAEQARQQEAAGRQRAEEEKRRAEARLHDLKRELEALRKRLPAEEGEGSSTQ